MGHKLKRWAALVLMGLSVAAPISSFAAAPLPAGVTVRNVEDGLVLADAGGRPLYRLDLDGRRRRSKDAGNLIALRCADVCARLWRPALAPKDFKPGADWSVTPLSEGPQLTYKGDPLYSFAGKSLDEAATSQVFPPYFSSYAAKPTSIVNGVPVATLYWHVALYQPPAPDVAAPAGVIVRWSKAAYVFADAQGRSLYALRSGHACAAGCGELEPLSPPLAALAVGGWRPVEGKGGERYWSYRGCTVYRAQDPAADAPGPDWEPLEAR